MTLWYVSTATQTDPLHLRVRLANALPPLLSVLGVEGFNLVCLEFVNSSIMTLESVWEMFGRVWLSSQSHMRPCHLGLLRMMTLSVVKEIQMSQKHLRLSPGPAKGGHRLQLLWCPSLTKIHLAHTVLLDLIGCWG